MIIRLDHINKVTAKGRTYYYFRPTGTRLDGDYGSVEFQASYNRAKEAWEKQQKKERSGTLGGLLKDYKASPEYDRLADATKADYLDIMDWLQPLSEVALVRFDTPYVMKIRNKAFKAHKRRFANYVLAFLSLVFNWGIPHGITTGNPAEAATKIAKPRGARVVNRPWTLDEFDRVMAAMPAELKVAVALGAYAGIRQGDVLRLPWSAYDGDIIQAKHRKTDAPLWVPAHSELRAILDTQSRRAVPIVVGARGKPLTGNGFRARFFKVIRALTKKGAVAPGLTFHGLRHTAATMLADAGCDERDIASITGHRDLASLRDYTRKADQKRRARGAMAKMEAEIIDLRGGRKVLQTGDK